MNTLRGRLNITSESLDEWAKEEMMRLQIEANALTRQEIEKRKKIAIIAIKSSRFLRDQITAIELPF